MALTEVRHTLTDVEQQPRTGVKVTARLIAANGYVVGTNQEIIHSVTRVTDSTGLVKLMLTPQSEIEYVGSAYEVTWAGLVKPKYISVPPTGPVNLRNILTTPPDLGGGGVGGVVSGRGVTSTAVVAGKLIVTYSDGTTQDAGTVNPGPAGAQGPTGPAGANGTGTTTIPSNTTRIAKVLTYTDGVGSTLFKRAKITFNVVDDFGADPTFALDSYTAFFNLFTAMAAETNGARAEVPSGRYRINGAARLKLLGDGVSFVGDGIDAAKLVFTHADGGLDIGEDVGVGISRTDGGEVSGLTLDGNGVARNPLRIGWCVRKRFANLYATNGAFNTLDTQAVRDKSALILVHAAQNCHFDSIQAKNSAGHGIVFDIGTGGHTFSQAQVNDIGSAGSVEARHVWFRQSLPATDPTHPTVYDRPTNILFDHGYIESATQQQAAMVQADSCGEIEMRGMNFASSDRSTAMTQIQLNSGCSEFHDNGNKHQGNNNASAGGVRVITGVHIAAGAIDTVVTSPRWNNTLVGMFLEAGVRASLEGSPSWNSGVACDGPGARQGLRRNFRLSGLLGALPTPSHDYLGVEYTVVLAGNSGSDYKL
ncbi:MAG: hypothetical protein M3349_07580, partial [Actinomycetota bacterium]|nr:hypothetical protein [Actinomycetota bacterium]